jgi:hypothetical protein
MTKQQAQPNTFSFLNDKHFHSCAKKTENTPLKKHHLNGKNKKKMGSKKQNLFT